jgi:hypothetical protein
MDTNILILVATFLAGCGVGYSVKVALDVRNTKNSPNASNTIASNGSTAQTGNQAGGHIAAGDINITGQ